MCFVYCAILCFLSRLLEVLEYHQCAPLHTDLGHCYTHMKKRDEAFEQFEAALRQVMIWRCSVKRGCVSVSERERKEEE